MKKAIIGICILLAVVYVAGTFVYKSTFEKEKLDEVKVFEADKIKSINVRTSFANIRVTSDTSENKIKVKLDGEINKKLQDQYQLQVEEIDGQLDIAYLSKENIVGIKLGTQKKINISILLPKEVHRNLNLTASSGNIQVENTITDNLELTTTSGTLSLIDSESKGDAIIHSTSGDITFENNTINSLNAETTSGKIKTIALDFQRGQIITTSGDVTLNFRSIMEELTVNTTSGNVAANFEKKPDSLKVVFEGDSGKFDISLPDMLYEDKDENFFIGIIGEGRNMMDVKTTSGNLVMN